MTEKLDPENLPSEAQERAQVAAELKQKALAAQGRGELIAAMLHASDALMLFPNEREYLDVVDEIVVSTNDPLSLVPVATGSVHVATAAVRARILMMQKDLAAAVELIGRVIDVAPDLAYLAWVQRWLQPHIIQGLGWDHLFEHVVKPGIRLAIDVPVPPRSEDPRLPNVRAAAQIYQVLRGHFPDQPLLYSGEALIRRRLDDPDATVAVAAEGVQRFPNDDRMQSALANALRDAKRPDEALQHYRIAHQLDPQDNSPLHDAGWAFMDVGRHQEALGLFQELLQRQPDYPEGQLSMLVARYRATGSEADKLQLIRLREREWGNRRTRALVNEIDPPEAYYNYLQGPGDATAAATRHLARELGPVLRCCGQGANISYGLRSEHLDSPSVTMAFDFAVRSLGGGGAKIEVAVEKIQQPDPRIDKAQIAYRLWNYDGVTATKVYPQAQPQAQQAIAGLADQVFRLDTWDAVAAQIAGQFGPEWVHAFIGVMTDPPPPPVHGEFDPFIWVYRCQVAAAVVLSHLGPWESGPGRPAIYSLIYGPSDWVTDAGLIALAWRARTNPALRPEAEAVFQWMRGQIPKEGFTSWEAPLAHLWLGVGEHPESMKQDLEKWLDDYYDAVPRKNRVPPPERRVGGLTLEEYAEFTWERDRIMGNVAYQGPGAAISAFAGGAPPQELVDLCQKYGVPLRDPQTGGVYPFITEWQEILNENGELHEAYVEFQRNLQLQKQGVSAQEAAALDHIRDGNMDMHLRMAQAQEAQRAVAEGRAGDPDPECFPGQPVARLSDYVAIMKGMQQGNMGILAQYGLDMMSYGSVATAWGAKMAADPVLTEKFTRMMSS
jgi:tetratricopeptide (TPR) repeat protein